MPATTALLLLLLGAMVYLLFTPVSISYHRNREGPAGMEIRLRPFPPLKFTPSPARKRARQKKPPVAARKLRGAFARKSIDSAYLIKMIRESLWLLSNLYRSLRRKEINLHLSGGVSGDPCASGQLYGACVAAASIMPNWLKLTFEPDFLADDLDIFFSFETEFRLASILANLLIFLIRIPKIKTAALLLGR